MPNPCVHGFATNDPSLLNVNILNTERTTRSGRPFNISTATSALRTRWPNAVTSRTETASGVRWSAPAVSNTARGTSGRSACTNFRFENGPLIVRRTGRRRFSKSRIRRQHENSGTDHCQAGAASLRARILRFRVFRSPLLFFQALLFFPNALYCGHFVSLVGSGYLRSLGGGLVGTHAGENSR